VLLFSYRGSGQKRWKLAEIQLRRLRKPGRGRAVRFLSATKGVGRVGLIGYSAGAVSPFSVLRATPRSGR